MKFLNHNLFTGDITVNGTTTLSTATGITRATGDNSTHLATTAFVKAQGYATTAALSGYVPITRTITINGTTLDLSADRAWTISLNATETDTLATVTTRGNTTTNTIDVGGVKSDYLLLDTAATPNISEGMIRWNSADGTAEIGLKYGDVVLQLGQEQHYVVRNSTGSTILNGTAVYASGVTEGSGRIEAAPYVADGSIREVRFLGLATHNISNGVNGVVTHFGYVRELDTRGTAATAISVGNENWSVGDILYVHPTVAGKLTNVKPKHEIIVAIIISRHQSSGVLFVRPSSAGHLDDIHDVILTSESDGQLLKYDSTAGAWVNWTHNFLTAEADTLDSVTDRGNTTTNAIEVGGLTVDTTTLVVDSTNNRVGIGTTSPAYKLDVSGTIFSGGSFGNRGVDAAYRIKFYDNGGVANDAGIGLDGSAGAEEMWFNSLNGFYWSTGTNGEKMRITQGGNVGIGTTSPQDKLTVKGATNYNLNLGLLGGYSGIYVYNDASSAYNHLRIDASPLLLNSYSGANVGIGTSSPGTKLDVNGVITATGGNSTNWNTAYSWGNHASAGYLTSESDTLNSVISRNGTTTGTAVFTQTSNTLVNTVAATNRGLTVFQDTAGADAYMTFHISGDYAGYFGLGGAENDLVWGGWSVGNARYRIWHSGNDGSTSGLDADLLDGQHGSYYQPASTAITTSNIGSQSVAYAGEAGFVSNQGGQLLRFDNRTISPSETSAGYLQFGFTSFNNDNSAPYADYLHMRSYTDASGGSDNLVMFKKSGIGMRIWQQTWGSSTAYSSYADVWTSGDFTSTNVSNWNTAYSWGNHASQGYATQTYVNTAISNLVDAAPTTLDTLNELAAALGDDPNFATTVATSIGTKLPLAGGTMTGNINWTSTELGLVWTMNTDGAYIKFFNTGDGDTNSRLEYATSDNGDEYHRFLVGGVERMAITSSGISATGYNKSNWDTAYSWGNHASAGYLTSYTETDTLATVTARGATTSIPITVTGTEGREVAVYIPSSYTTDDLVSGHEYGWYSDHWRLGMTRSGNTAGADFVVQWNGARRLSLTNGGNLTVTGTIGATNFSGTSSGTNTGDQTNITGNSGTATALQTGRTLTIGSTGKTFDGTGNVSWTLGEIGAQAAGSYVIANGTSAGNIDSDWGQSFKTFDPVPSGTPPIASPNLRTINVGEDFNRRTQLAFTYATDQAWFRRRDSSGWQTWREFIHSGNIGSQSVSYATTAGSVAFDNLTSKSSGTGTYQTSGDFRAPIFYDSNDTNFYGDFAGTSRFNITRNEGVSDTSYVRFVNPGGGYNVNSGPLNGAIKIKLPTAASYTNTMLSFTVKIYNYSTGTSRTICVGGYTYSTQDWYNVFAYQIGDNDAGSLTVRFGKDGTGACVWIGETDTYWSYPNVFITDVQSGHSQPASMSSGWNISFQTSFDTVQTSRVAYSQINAGNIGSQSVSYATTAGALTSMNISQFTNNSGYITGNQTITLGGDVSGSGTTSISVTVNNIDGWGFVNTGSNNATNADTIDSNGISYYDSGVTNFSGNATDGALYSQRYSGSWQHQIAGDYRSGMIAVRGRNNGTWTSWRTVIDSSTIGSQSVNYAASAGNADTLDTYHETAFVRLAANSSSPTNGTFAIGSASSRNFIQSHSGQPLDINPLGNPVTIGTDLTVDAYLTVGRAMTDPSRTRMFMPGGGSYVTTTSVVNGAIRIKLPTQGSGMMMTCTVKVYEYSVNKSFTITFGGHRDSANWYNEFCYIDGDKSRGNLTVRFGVSGGKDCVWIGETDSSWSYPQVFITDFQLGYTGYSPSWATGWEIAFTGSFDTINRTQTAYAKITGENIGSQSVSYATSAGSASSATTSSNVTVNSGNTSAAWYPIVWHSGNTLYSSSSTEIYAAGDYIRSQYINTTDNDETGITRFVIKNGDNYHRSATTTSAANIIRGVASGTWSINVTGSAGSATTAGSVPASGITGQNGMWTSAARPGAYRLYRNDDDSAYNVQTTWSSDVSGYWSLRGYLNDTYHAPCYVALAGTANSVAWTNVSGRPTAVSSFTNDSGYLTASGTIANATSATQVVTIQDDAPTGVNGKLWWESDTGKLKVYYGSSSAWVDATPVPDMSLYYAKAGGPISGDVTIQQTLTVVGNTLIQGTLTETSDISLKENILPLESSLDKVMKLNGVSFNKKATPNVKEIGFIAQEVEAVIPDLVTETNEGIKTVSYSRVTAVLVETIKEQQAQINTQQAQINELKDLVSKLVEKLNSL
jgi:hypothetical protein